MSFSTYYNYEGELHHCAKTDLERYRDEAKETIEECWKRLMVLAAMSPMDIINREGVKTNWPDYIQEEMSEIRDEYEDASWKYHHYCDAISAMEENPKNVHDDNDEWDEEKQQWVDAKL